MGKKTMTEFEVFLFIYGFIGGAIYGWVMALIIGG